MTSDVLVGFGSSAARSSEVTLPLLRRQRSDRPARRTRRSVAPSQRCALEEGDLVAERYRLTFALARGGMSVVWAAIDEHTGAEVVVKAIAVDSASRHAAERLAQEARLLAGFDCPHIVRCVGLGFHAGSPFLVLERLWGEDLGHHLRSGPLTPEETLRILRPIALALLVAHSHGVVHRDIKPANVFLAREGERTVPKLLDLGVAKLLEGARFRTDAGHTVGSPKFMSPEQVRAQPVGGRSDLFSLGSVAYKCLTGRSPFEAPDMHATFERIASGVFTPPSAVNALLPRALDDFFLRALALDPADRFQNAAEMMAALEVAAGAAG